MLLFKNSHALFQKNKQRPHSEAQLRHLERTSELADFGIERGKDYFREVLVMHPVQVGGTRPWYVRSLCSTRGWRQGCLMQGSL